MSKLSPSASFGLGSQKTNKEFSKNHFASNTLTPELKQKIASMGLNRVAGNIFSCSSDQSFWEVKNGKVMKLVGDEVDSGQSIPAADDSNPQVSLASFLDDLTF
jgi:hypothetical protein